MKVSIIFATFNRNDLLEQTLKGFVGLDTSGFEWEVILVDNAGNVDTARIAELFSELIPLKFLAEKAPGKNNALNYALEHAAGELIIFTDDDIIADANWVMSLVNAADRWETADLFGGRILPRYPEGLTPPFIEDDFFMRVAYVIADWGFDESEFLAGRIWGPNMMVRRRVFDTGLRFNPDIGPTGSNYVMGSELEFLHRARDLGYIAVYVPSALVYHQIRPEQLTNTWIYGRAFRFARSSVYREKSIDVPKIKKWMLREIVVLYCRYMWSYMFGTDSERLGHGIRFHKMRGVIYQSYIGRNWKTETRA